MKDLAQMVRQLRDETGAGFMDCKKALFACDMDMNKAKKWLKYNTSAIIIMDRIQPMPYDPVTDTVREEGETQ